MRAPVRLIGVAILVLLAATAFLLLNNRVPAQVPLADGTELRILQVSRGTNHVFSYENIWKQGMRRFLSAASLKFFGAPQVTQFQTRHDSLVIWVGTISTISGRSVTTKLDHFEALLPDGRTAEGRVRKQPSSAASAVEFARFERALPRVPLQVRDGAKIFPFQVVNPHQAKAARWESKPLPQTSETMQTKVTLTGRSSKALVSGSSDRFQVQVHARTLDNRQTAWMAWRATAFDSLGNWVECPWSYSGRGLLELPLLPSANSPWKVSVEGREYISAGNLFPLTSGNYQIGSIDERARALGVRFIMFTGNGTYLVTNGVVTAPNVPLPNAPATLTSWVSGTNWSLMIVTPIPGIACVFDQGNYPDIQGRIRERIEGNVGRIFSALRTVLSLSSTQTTTTARFFEMRLPVDTRNLEAEIIAAFPPVDFFIEPIATQAQ